MNESLHPLTQCPYCSMQCTFWWKQTEEGTKTLPNANDPVTHGKWCGKGRLAHIPTDSPERITTPLLKSNGKWHPVSWEEAMAWFSRRVRRWQAEFGPDAVAVYGGGSLTNEVAYLLGKFSRVALGTRYIDYNGRYCMSSAAAGANLTLGVDRGLTNPLSDLPLARCILLAGANVADAQPTMMPYLLEAKKRGAFLIVIDPRETPTAHSADLHLPIRPGTDAALVNGMLKIIVEHDLVDWSFVRRHTSGWESLIDHIRRVDLTEVVKQTGIPVELIKRAALAYGSASTGFVLTARGVEQHAWGVQNVRNFLNLVLLTGKIGKPGCGYGAITGQGNGQGGREHGQKADQLPGYRLLDDPEAREQIARIWGVTPDTLPRSGVSAYEMFDKILANEILGMIVFGSNPVISSPNAARVESALRRLDWLVVVDFFLTETAQMADLVLPAASYLENEGTITNLEGRVLLRRAVRPAPGEAKPDWQTIMEMAQALGKGECFRYQSAEDIFRELAEASRGGKADYSGMTYERIEQAKGLFWPCNHERPVGTPRLFEDGRFGHPDGKARLVPVHAPSSNWREEDEWPLTLTTGRIIHHYLSGTLTRRTPALMEKAPVPFLEVHPETAHRLGLADGQPARVTSPVGSIVLTVKTTERIRPDTVFAPFHWGGEQCINRLIPANLDPTSRMPAFKIIRVRVEPVREQSSSRQQEPVAITGI
ncbi:molybdopterin oxidoreductase family protein [Polycladomyces subterraneus]|uniref:Molybdopterin oxidoreductase family protein n=1 Tax=Polycladomyces subterraneus TaxID=1016997 RepID=A0ABT8IRA8_9BACL|nr:molybdopterin oxidoreductase family protein [Polycladomyces subterraneus]MDN4594629.1 molybdopterin oxidoreductase family protein [Polycladomyces subterraneus]